MYSPQTCAPSADVDEMLPYFGQMNHHECRILTVHCLTDSVRFGQPQPCPGPRPCRLSCRSGSATSASHGFLLRPTIQSLNMCLFLEQFLRPSFLQKFLHWVCLCLCTFLSFVQSFSPTSVFEAVKRIASINEAPSETEEK